MYVYVYVCIHICLYICVFIYLFIYLFIASGTLSHVALAQSFISVFVIPFILFPLVPIIAIPNSSALNLKFT